MQDTLTPNSSSFLLSNIDIDSLAESYRKKSYGYTEKHQDKFQPKVQYTYKPIWSTWIQSKNKFFVRVSVRSYVNGKFDLNEYLWFNVVETSIGIKAHSVYNKNLRFGLCSLRFADSQYVKIFANKNLSSSVDFRDSSTQIFS